MPAPGRLERCDRDTITARPSADLLAEVFPGVELTRELPHPKETLPAIDRARQVLGYEPRHSWRDCVPL